MKSDLVGRVKFDDMKTSTLYLDRRGGFVVLTSADDPTEGMIVHAVSKFKLGDQVMFSDNHKDNLEVLGGTVTLSNF